MDYDWKALIAEKRLESIAMSQAYVKMRDAIADRTKDKEIQRIYKAVKRGRGNYHLIKISYWCFYPKWLRVCQGPVVREIEEYFETKNMSVSLSHDTNHTFTRYYWKVML